MCSVLDESKSADLSQISGWDAPALADTKRFIYDTILFAFFG